MIHWKCIGCEEDLEAPESTMRQVTKCPRCGVSVLVPFRLAAWLSRFIGPKILVVIFTLPVAMLTYFVGYANGKQWQWRQYQPEYSAREHRNELISHNNLLRDLGINLHGTDHPVWDYEEVAAPFENWVPQTIQTAMSVPWNDAYIWTCRSGDRRFTLVRPAAHRVDEAYIALYVNWDAPAD